MSRYRQDHNAETKVDLDPGFIGVNAKVDPSLLRTGHSFYDINQQLAGPGVVADAVNMRFESGAARTRAGSVQPTCYNRPAVRYTGAGTFSDPNGRHWILATVSSYVEQFADGAAPRRIEIYDGVKRTTPTDLVQAFDSVIMFRGSGAWQDDALTPLVWDGSATGEFVEIAPTSSGSFTAPIPNADSAVVFGGRLYCAATRDQVAVSDLLDYTRWDPLLSAFRFNSGDDDYIVGLHPYRRNNLLVFKDQSIHVLANTYGDLSETRAELINGDLGLAARDSVASVGADVFFLSHDGVYRLSETVENSMSTQEVPVSDPIEPLIKRINRAYISKATAIVHDKYYRLAVPLDDAKYNNAVLVYDTTTGQWQGYDTVDRLTDVRGVSKFVKGDWHGRRHALSVCFGEDISENGIQVLDDEGAGHDISTSITTRGYVLGHAGIKRFRTVSFSLATLRPTLTFQAITEGQSETVTLASGVTRDRTKYVVHGKADYDTTNSNDDFSDPRREDYSVYLGDGTLANAGAGISLDRKQSWMAGYPVRQVGRWVAFTITNTTGAMTLKTVTADATAKPAQLRATV